MKYAVRFQQPPSSPAPLWIGHSDWTRCLSGTAVRASRLRPPDTHWWLNGCVWARDDDLAWRRHVAGQRWRRDIRAGWFDGDKKDVRSPGPQTCCHWRGSGRAAEMWVTAAQMNNIPQPESPCTLFSYKEPIYYKYWHKAAQGSGFFCQSVNSEMFAAENSARVSLRVRSQNLMHEGLLWHFIWLLLYAAVSLLLYQAAVHTHRNQPSSAPVCR